MSVQHANEARAIARAAKQLGAILPEPMTAALTHLDQLTRNPPEPVRAGTLAREISQHLGDPTALDKALKAGATHLAHTEAASKIHAFLGETCGARIRSTLCTNADEVTSRFGDALADDLATLEATARLLPEWFTEAQASSLAPATFTAWTQARDAYARIQSAQNALTPLYAGAIPQGDLSQFPAGAAATLRFAAPPNLDSKAAYAFRGALFGRTERVQGLAGQGSPHVDGIFPPTLLTNLGASFVWATPTEVTERAAAVIDGMTRKPRATTPSGREALAFP